MDKIIEVYNALDISTFRENISNLKPEDMKKLKNDFDNRYYNTGEDTIEDLKYDIFIEVLYEKDPLFNLNIGCKLRDCDNKTRLPVYIGGMDKIKKGETSKLEDWKKKNQTESYMLSDKLNGVSCLIKYNEKGDVKLYTRGDGVEGSDISYLSNKIKLPKLKLDIMVRGEFIITTKNFEKYKETYKNSLSLIVGVINSKTLKDAIKDIEFIAYEVVEYECKTTLEKNLIRLKKLGFSVVDYNIVSDISNESLSKILTYRKDTSKYDIDGIIVHVNTPYIRNETGNPSYAFAFKMLMEVVTVEVEDVEWNVSKWGILKPRISVTPTELTGITIKHTTGFNASYIRDNKINKGSKLVITRSGDIIPYIVSVVTQSEKPKMPDVEYYWNETGIDIIATNSSENLSVKQIVHFFTSLNVKQINEGVVSKLVKSGFDTILKILGASVEQLRCIPTFKDKMSNRIFNNIHETLQKVCIPDLMYASGCFGFGLAKRRINVLFNSIPTLLDHDVKIEDIEKVEGFSTKSASKIVENIPSFKKFLQDISQYIHIQNKDTPKSLSLQDNKYVFSGFRDKELEDYIVSNGGSVVASVSSKTTCVVVPDITSTSSKIEKAKELNIPIIPKSEIYNFFN